MIVTEWNIFRALDLDRVKAAMAAPVLVDLRNVYRADQVRAKGFSYADVGRGDMSAVEQAGIDAAA